MTGKELKEYAAQVHDDAIIEIRTGESCYGDWQRAFQMQAPYVYKAPVVTSGG